MTKWHGGSPEEVDKLPRYGLHIAGLTAGIDANGKYLIGFLFEPGEELRARGLPEQFLANYSIEDAGNIARQIEDVIRSVLQTN